MRYFNGVERCVQRQGMMSLKMWSLWTVVRRIQIIEEVISFSIVERFGVFQPISEVLVVDESRVRADRQRFNKYDEGLSMLLQLSERW